MFMCARCQQYADSDDGCDESPGGRLICLDCLDDELDEFAAYQSARKEAGL